MKMKFRIVLSSLLLIIILLIHSCSSTKYVPDGEYWLQDADIKIDTKKITYFDLEPYIQQKPNFETLTLFKLPLFIYNLSGRDTTKWVNRILRSGGEAPVLYDSLRVGKTVNALSLAMKNMGYVHAQVAPKIEKKEKKIKVIYDIKAGEPYRVSNYSISIDTSLFQNNLSFNNIIRNRQRRSNDSIRTFNINNILLRSTLVKPNIEFNLDMLDNERDRVSSIFRRLGYFDFDSEYIGYVADTTSIHKNEVDLELTVYPYVESRQGNDIIEGLHKQYVIKEVCFYVDFDPLTDGDTDKYQYSNLVTRQEGLYKIYYGKRGDYIRPFVMLENCYIIPGQLYNENATTNTYNAFSQLHILKNVNIRYQEVIENDSTKLRCVITCVPDKRQGISVELEGTNSSGQFGVGASLGYTHRNLFKGSELFNAKLQGSYEALSAKFSDFNKNYFEIGGETSVTFPRFLFPFLKRDIRKRFQASTQLTASYTYQRRPEYFTRTILSSQLSYIWNNRRNSSTRHSVDLINVSYVHIPQLSDAFKDKLTDAAREFSFTDQFILGSGYSLSKTNYRFTYNPLFRSQRKVNKYYNLRARVETAGNLLSLIAKLANAEKDSIYGSRKIFGTRFVQYVLGNADYSQTIPIDEKNTIAWRVGGGVVYPYGNYKMVPIQKRFFAGGANSVRGWSIRELGPGSFYKRGATFYDQSGEIRFDANIEYRSRFFWKFELAAFLDAGNIWTIKKYEEQEKGNFKFNSFYKEIAFAWGLGLRLDFDYVLIRLDCGWKLYDPADRPKRYILDDNGFEIPDPSAGHKSKWPVTKPLDFKKNTAWHIAVGYPF